MIAHLSALVHELSEQGKKAIDAAAITFAGVAAFSFWQGVALAVTILAGLASLTLACIRIHDRLKYGRPGDA